MTPLLALCVAAIAEPAGARVESLGLTSREGRPAIRISVSGATYTSDVHPDGEATRVTLRPARLGSQFANAVHVAWAAQAGFRPSWLTGEGSWPERVYLAVVGEAGVEIELCCSERLAGLSRDSEGLVLTLPPPAASASARAPDPPPGLDVASLAQRLFPHGDAGAETSDDPNLPVADLYSRLFPAAPETELPKVRRDDRAGESRHVRASLVARYVSADAFLTSASVRTRDQVLEISPNAALELPVGAGRLEAAYTPALRRFAEYDAFNSSSHSLNARLQLPVASRLTFLVREHHTRSTLETKSADPGGEYFYGLGRFWRNELASSASITLSARTSFELEGSHTRLTFLEDAAFFSHDAWKGAAGLGLDLTPSLRALASYVYDTVPRPSERAEAESRAHSARVSLRGDLLPLLTGDLSVGYRSHSSPNAAEEGRRFSGLVVSGGLTRTLSPNAHLSTEISRATHASAFEGNGFYVGTGGQLTLDLPLFLAVQFHGGVSGHWNDYRVPAAESGLLRHDRILGWSASLRRALSEALFLSGAIRREHRRSNVPGQSARSTGMLLQLEWAALGGTRR